MTNHSRIDSGKGQRRRPQGHQARRATLMPQPLYPCGDIDMQPLCRHATSILEDDR